MFFECGLVTQKLRTTEVHKALDKPAEVVLPGNYEMLKESAGVFTAVLCYAGPLRGQGGLRSLPAVETCENERRKRPDRRGIGVPAKECRT